MTPSPEETIETLFDDLSQAIQNGSDVMALATLVLLRQAFRDHVEALKTSQMEVALLRLKDQAAKLAALETTLKRMNNDLD